MSYDAYNRIWCDVGENENEVEKENVNILILRKDVIGEEERNRNLKGSKRKEKISDADDYSHFNTLTYFSEF